MAYTINVYENITITETPPFQYPSDLADLKLPRPAFFGRKVLRSRRKLLAFSPLDFTKSFTLQCNGLMKMVVLEIPNFTSTATTTISIKDENGIVVMSKALLAKNTNHILSASDDFNKAMAGTYTVTITLTLAPSGAGGNMYVTFYLK